MMKEEGLKKEDWSSHNCREVLFGMPTIVKPCMHFSRFARIVPCDIHRSTLAMAGQARQGLVEANQY